MILCLFSMSAFGQSDTLRYTFGAYLETYYGHGFTSPKATEKAALFYNHTALNQPAINLGLVEFSASKSKWTLRGDFMLGTYSQKNLASEPGLLKHIYQFNAQVQLTPKHLLIVGIMPSHIGLESAKNWENPSFSRSYIAENSPYYETGLAWSYSLTQRMNVKVLALTGWQTMHRFRPALPLDLGCGGRAVGRTGLPELPPDQHHHPVRLRRRGAGTGAAQPHRIQRLPAGVPQLCQQPDPVGAAGGHQPDRRPHRPAGGAAEGRAVRCAGGAAASEEDRTGIMPAQHRERGGHLRHQRGERLFGDQVRRTRADREPRRRMGPGRDQGLRPDARVHRHPADRGLSGGGEGAAGVTASGRAAGPRRGGGGAHVLPAVG